MWKANHQNKSEASILPERCPHATTSSTRYAAAWDTACTRTSRTLLTRVGIRNNPTATRVLFLKTNAQKQKFGLTIADLFLKIVLVCSQKICDNNTSLFAFWHFVSSRRYLCLFSTKSLISFRTSWIAFTTRAASRRLVFMRTSWLHSSPRNKSTSTTLSVLNCLSASVWLTPTLPRGFKFNTIKHSFSF